MTLVSSLSEPEVLIVESPRILLVDDDSGSLCLLSICLQAAGYIVISAVSSKQALNELITSRPNIIITNLRTDDIDGMEILEILCCL